MDTKRESIKEEIPLLEGGQIFTKIVTMKTNCDAVFPDDHPDIVKTEIKSETPVADFSQNERGSLSKHLIQPLKSESVTSSNSCNIDIKTEIEEQVLVSDSGSQNKEEFCPEGPVIKVEEYNSEQEMCSKIEIKEEPLWIKVETSSVCEDIKEDDIPPVKSSRLSAKAVSSDIRGISPLSPAEVSGRDTSFCNEKDYTECQSEAADVSAIPNMEDHSPSEQSSKYGDAQTTISKTLFLKQKNLIHKGERPHQCNICEKKFILRSHLKAHNLIHEGKRPHQCKTCDKNFKLLSHLQRHNLIHEGMKPYQCKTCDKNFTQLSHLKRHNLIHEGIKPYQCKICDKNFSRLSHLKRHNFIHEGMKPYSCKTCDKSFAQLSSLKRHNLIHGGNKPYHCKMCNKSFIQLSSMKRHDFIHKGKKPHNCKMCDKSFAELTDLKRHILSHEGKKPHKCKICDKSFTLVSNLYKHNLIHEGKKSHQCNTCYKSFTKLGDLRIHNLIHEGKKPHQCKTCDKRFTQLSSLKRHYLTHKVI